MKKTNSLQKKPSVVMIAEDDEGILDAMKMMLELNGYTVITTTGGNTVEKIRKELPDLLLLDILLSGVDGKTVCKEIKEHDQTSHIPIILVSATKNLENEALEAGADAFLEKPFEMETLLALVEKYKTN